MRHVCGGPNIVRLLDVVKDEDLAASLVFEYINNTDFMVRALLYTLAHLLHHTFPVIQLLVLLLD